MKFIKENLNMFRSLTIYVLILISSGCASEQDSTVLTTDELGYKPPIKCSSSPPILDTQKIKLMLERNGTITSTMTSMEIDRIVDEYIQRKNKSVKDCK